MDNDAAEKADFNLVFGEDVNPKLNDALRQANDVFQKFINQRNPGAIIKIATLYVRMPNGSTYAVNTPDGNEKKADKMDISSPSPSFWILLLHVVGVAFGFPLIVLVIGKSLEWVFVGFSRNIPALK